MMFSFLEFVGSSLPNRPISSSMHLSTRGSLHAIPQALATISSLFFPCLSLIALATLISILRSFGQLMNRSLVIAILPEIGLLSILTTPPTTRLSASGLCLNLLLVQEMTFALKQNLVEFPRGPPFRLTLPAPGLLAEYSAPVLSVLSKMSNKSKETAPSGVFIAPTAPVPLKTPCEVW